MDLITKAGHRKAAEIIKRFEGLRLQAYHDSVGVPTIGWGTTHYTNGKPVKMRDSISEEQAEVLLAHDMHTYEEGIKRHVAMDLGDDADAALISFAYNLGLGNLYHSHLLTYINEGRLRDAADEWPKWCHAGGKVLDGLVKRRNMERDLFLKGVA